MVKVSLEREWVNNQQVKGIPHSYVIISKPIEMQWQGILREFI